MSKLNKIPLKILWPNDEISNAEEGDNWFLEAEKAGISIPTGCLNGSCGACEIDVNGETIRPCVTNIEFKQEKCLHMKFIYDPFWQ